MTISWGNLDVRVYAAEAWVSLAQRFASEHPVIVDRLEEIIADPVPSVRLQVAQNLQVIHAAAPERMWRVGERIAAEEVDLQVLSAYLGQSMRRFSHSDPDRCEKVLMIVRGRLDAVFADNRQGYNLLQGSLGGLTAQMFVGQARALIRAWLEEWAADPARYGELLDSFTSPLRETFFRRYAPNAATQARAMCDRAQEGLDLILTSATSISADAYAVLVANPSDEDGAREQYRAAEKVINHAMDQLYFGSGAYANNREDGEGLPDVAAKKQFLIDYSKILKLLASSREPATLHRLVELYEFLIPGDPVAVFEAIHAILLGRGEEEGYHYESLGNTKVVSIIQRYIADYRTLFDDEDRRARLATILNLFSTAGWPDALKLLYDLPDLLR